MTSVDYQVSRPAKEHLGKIGISRIGPNNQYVMVVEGQQIGTCSLLILSKEEIRISSNSDLEILILPGAVIRPDISLGSIEFKDVGTVIGSIRFVDGRAKLSAKCGEAEKYVDIDSGATEGNFADDAPKTKKWDIIRPTINGKLETVFSFP